MKNFLDLVKKRHSIRKYKPDPVPREMIEKCLEAARHAPTACNKQSWKFHIVEGELKNRLVEVSLGGVFVPNKWASTVPVIAVIAMNLDLIIHRVGGKVSGVDYHMVDAGIAGEHFVLQATELGLGTCWIGWFNKKAVKKLLDIPAGWDVPAMIGLGFPDEEPIDKNRRHISEISDFKADD
ncbi:MAG: NAD(P)H nitroreductase [Candidatus Latescibacteria bacterium]|nr:NAD(P)H nitroreductase [Candidatus Latescibacterota bacterium]NIO28391.1 NAD(P)H nitroreductase [Candidatus Latescibacterota bacterium]NIO55940.1 NAD(P)H nitroreductase [Candidatus Latescibacterota bacterium]NIT01904.1 NAD(P)H nitroreductase [Candidatus Latescibacterota bacterium]